MSAITEMQGKVYSRRYESTLAWPQGASAKAHNRRDVCRADQLRLNELFKADLLLEFGLTGTVGDKAYEMAWDRGHSSGLLEVLGEFADLAALLEKTRIGEEHVFECGETGDEETEVVGESESQSPVEWVVMLRGAETMLYGAGRAHAFKEIADEVRKFAGQGWTAPQLGRLMASYVRNEMEKVMREEQIALRSAT